MADRRARLAAMRAACELLAAALIPIQAAAQTPRSGQTAPASSETYESVTIDADGNLRILTSSQRAIIIPKGGFAKAGEVFGQQTAFQKPVISDDGRSVGAQAIFENCCTSYDIPLQLVIYSRGKTHRFEGGLAIFDWHFADRGRRVVFSQGDGTFWLLGSLGTERPRKREASGHCRPTGSMRRGSGSTEGEGAEVGNGDGLGVQVTGRRLAGLGSLGRAASSRQFAIRAMA
jgi:hypothetical protein